MLNMKFAEMMELTEDELMEVTGGSLLFGINALGNAGGAGGYGLMGYGVVAPSWRGDFSNPSGYFDFTAPETESSRWR